MNPLLWILFTFYAIMLIKFIRSAYRVNFDRTRVFNDTFWFRMGLLLAVHAVLAVLLLVGAYIGGIVSATLH